MLSLALIHQPGLRIRLSSHQADADFLNSLRIQRVDILEALGNARGILRTGKLRRRSGELVTDSGSLKVEGLV